MVQNALVGLFPPGQEALKISTHGPVGRREENEIVAFRPLPGGINPLPVLFQDLLQGRKACNRGLSSLEQEILPGMVDTPAESCRKNHSGQENERTHGVHCRLPGDGCQARHPPGSLAAGPRVRLVPGGVHSPGRESLSVEPAGWARRSAAFPSTERR